MLEWDSQEKTEQPTPAKRDEARRKGQVPRSLDLTVALSLLVSCAALYYFGPWVLARGGEAFRLLLGQLTMSLETGTVTDLAFSAYSFLLIAVLPIAACTGGVILASSALQTGAVVRFEALSPDFSRLSPASALRRLFSLRSFARGLFAGLKLATAGLVVGWILYGSIVELARLAPADISWTDGGWTEGSLASASWGRWWGAVGSQGMKVCAALVGLGLLEYFYQRWQHERDLRMSRTELEEEIARQEGKREYKSQRQREGAKLLSKTEDVKRIGGES